MADFGSSDSGASLGDILGPAIKGRQEQQERSRELTGGARAARGGPELDVFQGFGRLARGTGRSLRATDQAWSNAAA